MEHDGYHQGREFYRSHQSLRGVYAAAQRAAKDFGYDPQQYGGFSNYVEAFERGARDEREAQRDEDE